MKRGRWQLLAVALIGLLAGFRFWPEAARPSVLPLDRVVAAGVPSRTREIDELPTLRASRQWSNLSPEETERLPKTQVLLGGWTPKPEYASAALAMVALQARVASGDPKAMTALARALEQCRLEPADADEALQVRNYEARTGVPMEESSDEDREFDRAHRAYCNLPRAVVFDTYKTSLLTAADAGDAEAQTMIATLPPFDAGYRDRLIEQFRQGNVDLGDPLDGEPTALARRYAAMARDSGEANALFLLASFETQKPPGEQDLVELYVDARLLGMLPNQTWRPGMSSGYGSEFMARLEARMRAVDLDRARAQLLALMAAHPVWVRRPMVPDDPLPRTVPLAAR